MSVGDACVCSGDNSMQRKQLEKNGGRRTRANRLKTGLVGWGVGWVFQEIAFNAMN